MKEFFMHLQFKKYFLVFLFSVTSFVIYSDEGEANDSKINSLRLDNSCLRKQECAWCTMSDALWVGKKTISDRCRNFKNKCEEMVDVVNCDPGFKLKNGLISGGLLGIVNVLMFTSMNKWPNARVVASFVLPTTVVSYLVASRNITIHNLSWNYAKLREDLDCFKK